MVVSLSFLGRCSAEKTVDGKTYKWCGKCRGNKGLWTTGKHLHSTAEHRPKKDKETDKPKTEEAARLAYIDEPLDFGFLAMYPSEWRSDKYGPSGLSVSHPTQLNPPNYDENIYCTLWHCSTPYHTLHEERMSHNLNPWGYYLASTLRNLTLHKPK